MLRLATLAMLSLPLAGCLAPADLASPPMAGAGVPPHPDGAPRARAASSLGSDVPPCPVPPPPREHREVGYAVVEASGCLLAALDAWPLGTAHLPSPRANLTIPAGAERLRVLFHLHDRDPIEVWLQDPQGQNAAQAQAEGTGDVDSFVELVVPSPAAGRWEVRAFLLEPPVAAKGWSAALEARWPAP